MLRGAPTPEYRQKILLCKSSGRFLSSRIKHPQPIKRKNPIAGLPIDLIQSACGFLPKLQIKPSFVSMSPNFPIEIVNRWSFCRTKQS